jgi:hypothetical protein
VVRQHPAVLNPAPRLATALVASVLLVVYGFGSSLLPSLPLRAGVIVSSAVVLCLMALLVWGLLPLQTLGRRLWLLAAAALPLWILFTWAGLAPLANVAKIVGAAALGLWIAGELERLSWIVVIAVVTAVVDIVSVAAGPTKALLAHGPVVVGYFTIAITWFGYSYTEAYTGLGVSDVVFFALYLGAAQRFRLRPRASAVAMVVSFVVTIAAAMWATALPALPLLAVSFLLANADLLWRRLQRGAPSL